MKLLNSLQVFLTWTSSPISWSCSCMTSWTMKQTMLRRRKVSIWYIHADFFSEAQLPRVVRLLEHFPRDMLDVVVGCTRKTEVRLWHYLFQYVGRPKELFEQCMERGMLK